MTIATEVMKRLNSFENSELSRLLEALAEHEYYMSGYKSLCGGYATAEAFNIEEDGYYDEEADEEFDSIEIELESGLQDGNRLTCTKACFKIARPILGNKDMSLKEKLEAVEEL